jgi:hypothetical protein
MNNKLLESDVKTILEMKARYNFIVIDKDHEIFIDRFKNRIEKGVSNKQAKIRFANALQRCLETHECTLITDHNPPLFDFSRGHALSKYW